MRLHLFVVLLAAVSERVSSIAIGPNSNLWISNDFIAPDGYNRSAALAGATFPGPLIQAEKEQFFAVNVINLLDDESMDLETSIHWHGIFQKYSNFADGGAFVNQCPIIPNQIFTYQFNGHEQAGTFWYHSHFKAQYCDGVRGPLVIYDPNDPHFSLYDFDDEDTVITLADWYHYPSTQAPTIPQFNSTLINGIGRYPDGPNVTLAVVNVMSGARYRLRLVSISCEPAFTFSIDGHNLTIIEVDGINHEPLIVDSIQIFAGQRYSVVLNANQTIGNYWIRAVPNIGNRGFTGLTNLAYLSYLGANFDYPSDPTQNIPSSVIPLKETDLHPLVPTPVPGKPFPGGADVNIYLKISIGLTGFLVNGVSFESPDVPVLLQILNGAPASQLLPKGSVYAAGANQSVEVTIVGGGGGNTTGGPHPIHLHGHAFHVVRSAGNSTYNFDNPVMRDVVSAGSTADNVTFRFITDNPGPWFLHCHIDWHLTKGFAAVIAEDVPDVSTTVHPPDKWTDLCPEYNDFTNTSA